MYNDIGVTPIILTVSHSGIVSSPTQIYFSIHAASPIVTKDNISYATHTPRAAVEDTHDYTYISLPVFPLPQLHDVPQPYAIPQTSRGK